MDDKYEFEAPQYVDFNNLTENDDNIDEFFNVDMESGEAWVTANNTLERSSIKSEGEKPPDMDVDGPQSMSVDVTVSNPPPTGVLNSNQIRKAPSNMVTSWGGPVTRILSNGPIKSQHRKVPSNLVTSWEGPVTKVLERGHHSQSKPTHSRKNPQGKVGRADLQSTVQDVFANTRKTPKHLHQTPRRFAKGSSRLLGCTPKRLGTNSLEPRLAVPRPRTQIQKSLNTPTARKYRRNSKSPAAPIPFPKTPAVMQRYKNRMLENEIRRVHDQHKVTGNEFKSQAQLIQKFQHSTPTRFRTRPVTKSIPVDVSKLSVLGPNLVGAKPKVSGTRLAEAAPSSSLNVATKATIVQSISSYDKDNPSVKRKELRNCLGVRGKDKSAITIPAPFKFTTEQRAEERLKFETLLREKENAAMEKRKQADEEKEKEEREALVKARRALVHKAQPIKCSKPLMIRKSEKTPTNPVTPHFQKTASQRRNN